MRLKSHIPNLITLGNLFCGCIALVFVFKENFMLAFAFAALGIVLDFFDGFFARILNVPSALGLQLDSMADMVTSGVVPGATMFFMLSRAVQLDWDNISLSSPDFWICLTGFAVTLGSGMRLARFNIDTRQTDSFIGLPTPANSLFILSLPIVRDGESFLLFEILSETLVLVGISLFSAFVLNAEIPLFSLKTKEFGFSKNKLRYFFLALSVFYLAYFQLAGIPLIIVSYVLLSVINNKFFAK